MVVTDPTQTQAVALGKQWSGEGREDMLRFIMYTPTSGIWQTVWLEPVEEEAVERLQVRTDVDNHLLRLEVITTSREESRATIVIQDEGDTVIETEVITNKSEEIVLGETVKTWSPDQPFLYDLRVSLASGDSVTAYFGVRKVEMRSENSRQRFYLNNKQVPFQVGPLDQGYWPDGILTAPSDQALKWDLEQTKLMGFNMVRKHIKIESRRWYYWADKLGLIVWQDFPSISDTIPHISQSARDQFQREAVRWLDQLQSSPSILLWVVFNEGWGQHDTVSLTNLVMETDPDRLVCSASGWTDHQVGHVIDVHVYPGPSLNLVPEERRIRARDPSRLAVVGEMWGKSRPILGHNWFGDHMILPDPRGVIQSEDQFISEYEEAVRELLELRESHGYAGAVITQTTDVEAELNGLMTYDRRVVKFETERLARLNTILCSGDHQVISQFLSKPPTNKISESLKSKQEKDFEENMERLSYLIEEGIIPKEDTVFCFDISDCHTKWYLDLKSGTYQRGSYSERPDSTIKMISENFLRLFSGQLSPSLAFLTLRLGVSGDWRKALKLRSIIKTLQDQSSANREGNRYIDQLFEKLAALLTEDLVRETQAVFLFHLRDQMLDYFIDLKTGAGSCARGRPSSPADARLTMTFENFNKVFTDKLKPTTAYMSGRLRISGSLPAAMRLLSVFEKLDVVTLYKSIIKE